MWKAVSIKSVDGFKLSRPLNINEKKNNRKPPQNKTKSQTLKKTKASTATCKKISRKENHTQKLGNVLGSKSEASILGLQKQSLDIELTHIIYLIEVICCLALLAHCASLFQPLYFMFFYSEFLQLVGSKNEMEKDSPKVVCRQKMRFLQKHENKGTPCNLNPDLVFHLLINHYHCVTCHVNEKI